MTGPERDPGAQKHGNVFGRGWGNMFIHVQRETGLAHRTMVLRPWQVQALRLVASKWFAAVFTVAILSWAYFAFQTARVPFLTRRITHLEQDAAKIDTLQATLEQLQRRYTQVQQMLSASARSTPPAPAKETKPAVAPGKAPVTAPVQNPAKAPANAAAKAPPLAFLHHGARGEERRATEYDKGYG
ncbi:MAG: hypothetical protein WC700_03035 [Gemmatimonadaceae bacterium]|jgi:hypothetical protein